MKAFSEKNHFRFIASLTCAKAIEGNSIALTRKFAPEALETVTEVILSSLFMIVSVGKTFDPNMMPLVQAAIFKKYYYLTIEEYAYVLRMGAAGEYGKIYDRIDLPVLMEWFEKYDTGERLSVVERRNHNRFVQEQKEAEENVSLLQIVVDKNKIKEIISSIGEDYDKIVLNREKEEQDYQEYKKQYMIEVMKKEHLKTDERKEDNN